MATSTIPSTGLKELLDTIDFSGGGRAFTKVWDSHELEIILTREGFQDLVKLYMPKSYASIRSLDEPRLALRQLEQVIPDHLVADLRNLVLPSIDKRSRLVGVEIWPYDRGEAEIIDYIIASLIDDKDAQGAVDILFDHGLEFDAYMAMLREISNSYHSESYEFLSLIVKRQDREGVSFNAFSFIRDHFEFETGDQPELASYLAPDELDIHYGDEIRWFVMQELCLDPSSYELWPSLDELSSHTVVDEVSVDTIDFVSTPGAAKIEFLGRLRVSVLLYYGGKKDRVESTSNFPGEFAGHFDSKGTFLTSATADTSSFYE